MTLDLTGADVQADYITITDVTATGKTLYNYAGGTLTRTTNVVNFLTTPGDYTDPGIANVKTGVGYTYAASALTGTYDGSDRWTDPGIANVRTGTAYKANSTSNNRTGTCAVPAASNVLSGVSVDATTGTFDEAARNTDPGVGNVLSGTGYKIQNASLTGTLVVSGGSPTYSRGRVVNA
jgi:hypothetical protein